MDSKDVMASLAVTRLFYRLPHDARRWLFAATKPKKFGKLQKQRNRHSEQGYSFKPFDEHRCIFVHVPKTAGVSISRELFGNLSGGHTSIATYERVFSRRDFESYFKFAFVRNPWDRLYSAYRFLKSGGMSEGDRQWAERNLSGVTGFTEFVTEHLRRGHMLSSSHFVPQYRFLCRPGSTQVLVDFVGRYESLDRDFRAVKERLGLGTGEGLAHFNRSQSDGADYRFAYTAETRRIVADVYREDVELFGYAFEPGNGDDKAVSGS